MSERQWFIDSTPVPQKVIDLVNTKYTRYMVQKDYYGRVLIDFDFAKPILKEEREWFAVATSDAADRGSLDITKYLHTFLLYNKSSDHILQGSSCRFGEFTINCGAKEFYGYRSSFYDELLQVFFRNMFESYAKQRYSGVANSYGDTRVVGLSASILVGSDNVEGSTVAEFRGIEGWMFSEPTHNRNYMDNPNHKIQLFWKNIGEFEYAHNWC